MCIQLCCGWQRYSLFARSWILTNTLEFTQIFPNSGWYSVSVKNVALGSWIPYNCGPQCFLYSFCMVDTPLLWTKTYTQLFDTNYDMVLWASIIPTLSQYLPGIVFFFLIALHFSSPRDMLVQSKPCFSAHCEKWPKYFFCLLSLGICIASIDRVVSYRWACHC